MSCKLHVGNLEEHTTPDQLRPLFERAGRVISIEIVSDPATGRSRGYGFVMMATQEEAARAIAMLSGHHVNYRPLILKQARKTDQQARPRRK